MVFCYCLKYSITIIVRQFKAVSILLYICLLTFCSEVWHTFRGGSRFVTVCDRGGSQKSSKIAWHTLWTAPYKWTGILEAKHGLISTLSFRASVGYQIEIFPKVKCVGPVVVGRELHGDKKSSSFLPRKQCFVPITAATEVILMKLFPLTRFTAVINAVF